MTTTQAHKQGQIAKEKGRMRISPFYEEKAVVDGKRVDVTASLEAAWLAGFDGKAL
jgi:hypothetical protein